MSKNIACIYQPHFQTECYRVAKDKQCGVSKNYIIVTCCPSRNGVYVYDANKTDLFDEWKNRQCLCVCVPWKECKKVAELSGVTKKEIIDEIKKQQDWWFKNRIKGDVRPAWMI